MRPIFIRPAARQDFLDACSWYGQQSEGLDDRFEAAVGRTLDLIARSAESFPKVYRDVRRALVRPFPYGISFGNEVRRFTSLRSCTVTVIPELGKTEQALIDGD